MVLICNENDIRETNKEAITISYAMKMTSEKQIKKPLPSFCICHIAGRDCFRTPVNKTTSISQTVPHTHQIIK